MLNSCVLENRAQLFAELALGLGLISLPWPCSVCIVSLVTAGSPYPVPRVAVYVLDSSSTMTSFLNYK